MAVLIAIIIMDILAMAFVMRMVLTEPPHPHPAQHPLALQAAQAKKAAAAQATAKVEAAPEKEEVENKDDTLPVADDSDE